ncbi:hypothetical protein D1872_223150 [compost metagenome]
MAEQNGKPVQPLRFRRLDVIRMEYFEHAGTSQAGDKGDRLRRQSGYGKNVIHRSLEAHRRQPVQLRSKYKLQ